jgi:hypothetical protein
MNRVLFIAVAFVLAAYYPAFGHSWYKEKKDPVYQQGCCGDYDCSPLAIEPGVLWAVEEGYRVVLTLEQSRAINPMSSAPIDALVTWDRVQPSEDGNYHICIMSMHRANARQGVYCFFAPPNT